MRQLKVTYNAYRRGFITSDDSLPTTIIEEAIAIDENAHTTPSYRRFFSIGPAEMTDRNDGSQPSPSRNSDVVEMTSLPHVYYGGGDRLVVDVSAEETAAAVMPNTDYGYPPNVVFVSWRNFCNTSFVDDSIAPTVAPRDISSYTAALRLDLVEIRSIGNKNGCDSTTAPVSEIHYFLGSIYDVLSYLSQTLVGRLLRVVDETHGMYHYREFGCDDNRNRRYCRRILILSRYYGRSGERLVIFLRNRSIAAAAASTVLYRESLTRLIALRALSSEDKVLYTRLVREDLPLREQAPLSRASSLGINEYALHSTTCDHSTIDHCGRDD